ncbi:hypothetical protein BOO91_17960 [Vibrio navarrensis]|nr:hypothetical protein UF06_18695 [Vibrio sp. S234-5]MBE3662819.1 hypothetical protein [Vibrio navarrensis]MBE3668152.1 hypothetical protein [Vibrio navarrensis]MBE4591807.1 hypothetical protein [Vibrio navarrensis]MBE4605700.1 hypothetical protein [Vibrio navarrensis]
MAHFGPLRLAKQLTQVLFIELNTAHSGRLTIRHTWDRRRNTRGDTACAAAKSAIHQRSPFCTEKSKCAIVADFNAELNEQFLRLHFASGEGIKRLPQSQ